jgi:hypothetical protein
LKKRALVEQRLGGTLAFYELAILGSPSAAVLSALKRELKARLNELGLRQVDVSTFIGPASGFVPSEARCSAALCFPADSSQNPYLERLIERDIPLIPIARAAASFSSDIPTPLKALNGLALDRHSPAELVFALLECAGLLPRQRRVFISYRRQESTDAALQLYAELSARGFEVFLDTHKIHPGEHFQRVLWQRLCDCDVLVMLDTKGYFQSRWTDEEFGKALVRGLAIVRVGWPRVKLSRRAQVAVDVQLTKAHFKSRNLTAPALRRVCNHIEEARTKSVAVRYDQLIETLRRSIRRAGGKLEGVCLRRRVIVSLPGKKPIAVYPALGVPTTNNMHDATLDEHTPPAAVVYDDVGIDEKAWRLHMEWIGRHLQGVVRLVPGYKAGWDFSGWHVV